MRAEQDRAFDDLLADDTVTADETVARAVGAVVAVFTHHERLLRAVVLISGAHPEVYRRGARYNAALGATWSRALLRHADVVDHPSPPAAVSAAFDLVFAAMVVRTAYGVAFTTAPSTVTHADDRTRMVQRYLFAPGYRAGMTARRMRHCPSG